MNKRFRQVSILAIATCATAVAFPSSAEKLADAIRMAYDQNPTLGRARAQQRAVDEQLVQSQSQFGPSVSFGASQSYSDQPQNLSGDRSYQSVGLSVSQNIFTSGGMRATLDQSKAIVRSGQESLRATESQIVLQVISIYTAVRRDQDAYRISQENYDILEKQRAETTAQMNAGQLTKTDVAQAQARLAGSKASLASAQAQLDNDRATYVSIVGQAPTALEPAPPLPSLPVDFDAALGTAEQNNPDLLAAQYSDESAIGYIKEARAYFGPTVSLSGSISKSNVAGQLGETAANAAVTLKMSVPLYSSGLNSSRVRQALNQETAAHLAVEEARRKVISDVSQAWSDMLAAKSSVLSNQQQVAAAATAAEGVKTEQQAGLRTPIEVLNAQQELKSAQLDLVDAQRNSYLASAQLLSSTGQLTAQAFVPELTVYDPKAHLRSVARKGWTPIIPVVQALDKAGEAMIPAQRK